MLDSQEHQALFFSLYGFGSVRVWVCTDSDVTAHKGSSVDVDGGPAAPGRPAAGPQRPPRSRRRCWASVRRGGTARGIPSRRSRARCPAHPRGSDRSSAGPAPCRSSCCAGVRCGRCGGTAWWRATAHASGTRTQESRT